MIILCPCCSQKITVTVTTELTDEGHEKLPIENLINLVLEKDGISKEDLLSKCRKRHLVYARQKVCYLAKRFTRLPLAHIAAAINLRDHSTVINCLDTLNDLMDTEPHIQKEIENLCKVAENLKQHAGLKAVA